MARSHDRDTGTAGLDRKRVSRAGIARFVHKGRRRRQVAKKTLDGSDVGFVAPSDLDFDLSNPRFLDEGFTTEDQVLRYLVDAVDVDELLQLSEVLGNPEAQQMLLAKRDLQVAFERVEPPSSRFADALMKATRQSEEAMAASGSYDGDPTLLRVAINLVHSTKRRVRRSMNRYWRRTGIAPSTPCSVSSNIESGFSETHTLSSSTDIRSASLGLPTSHPCRDASSTSSAFSLRPFAKTGFNRLA